MSKLAKLFGVGALALSTLIPSVALACNERVEFAPRPVVYEQVRYGRRPLVRRHERIVRRAERREFRRDVR